MMNRGMTRVRTAAAMLLALALAAPALAQDAHGDRHGRDRDRHRDRERHAPVQGDHIRNGRVIFADPQPAPRQHPQRHRDDRGRRHWDNGRRGPPPWAKGRDYRDYRHQRVLPVPHGDYRRYGLYAPRPGHRWLYDDAGHYLLVADATGIIGDIVIRRGF